MSQEAEQLPPAGEVQPEQPCGALFYLYRFRTWDSNVYWGNREAPTPEDIMGGWGEWEWIDEKKYNEILEYIKWPNPSHYQAERIVAHVVDSDSFSPQAWIDDQLVDLKERNPTHPKVR